MKDFVYIILGTIIFLAYLGISLFLLYHIACFAIQIDKVISMFFFLQWVILGIPIYIWLSDKILSKLADKLYKLIFD